MSEETGLDLSALRSWLDDRHPDLLPGPLSAELLVGGRSNLTFLVSSPRTPTRVVLRRPPLGDHPATAHDVGRELRIIRALAGSAVPVPGALAWCPDATVIGAPFYLMGYVDGLVLRTVEQLAPYDDRARADLAERLVATLADIHAVDLESAGLDDLGRPEGYLERQVARWQRHLEVWGSANREQLAEVGRDLAAQIPVTQRTSLVHGDFRLDNALVGHDDLAILAVIDWEMATVGDPLADLGLFLVYWDLAAEVDNALSTAMGPAAGFPPGAALARSYAGRSGLSIADLDWYVALGAFKLAVVLEGVRQRESAHPVEGQRSVEDLIPLLVARARDRL